MSGYDCSSKFDEEDKPGKVYFCAYCNKLIGKRKKINHVDKNDKAYCSDGCSTSGRFHWSREYEWRGEY